MAQKYYKATQLTRKTGQVQRAKPQVITIGDRRRLGSLLADDDLGLEPDGIRELEERLDEAAYIDCEDTPENLVTMNTTVELANARSREKQVLTLAYPDEAEFIDDSISVLEPLGLALLGSFAGDVIQCAEGRAAAEYRIRRIIYQPEQVPASPR